MDASASKRTDAEIDKLLGLYFKIENSAFPSHLKQKRSVIKYTRLPDFDNNALWSRQNFTLEPRLRRIITIEEPRLETRRSLKSDIIIPPKIMASEICKRKIVTIEEDDEYSLYPRFSHEIRKTINRAIETDIKDEKQSTQRKISRLTNSSKNVKDMKPSAKANLANTKKEIPTPKSGSRFKYSKGDSDLQENSKNKSLIENEIVKNTKSAISSSKFNLSKKLVLTRQSEKDLTDIKSKYKDDSQNKMLPKKPVERSALTKSPSTINRSKMKDIKERNKPVTIIRVPLDDKLHMRDASTEMSEDILDVPKKVTQKVEISIQAENKTQFKDMNVGTEVMYKSSDQNTKIDELIQKCNQNSDKIKETFDSLDIPNVSLTNNIINKNDMPKEEIVSNIANSTSNLEVSSINKYSQDEEDTMKESLYKSTSFIIGSATLTYTTRQKINFHVVGSNEILKSHLPSSPFSYPLNVVSMFKKEIKKKDICNIEELGYNREDDKSHDEMEQSNSMTSINCSYVFDSDKLVKPSDIISTIKVNNSLLQGDYICEQFQRELNFVDSFVESLQYLENCSLSEKCIAEKKVENWINSSGHELKNFEFGSFLSRFENEGNVDDSKTMASKSLCLLNLLIRDEQRRAKNLLFVLKMREDALKDFTKSQILWLENKKKQENTDISTLKKKQRGALLKLQHECGEMQRMRKALLTLSEKRKIALIKTKKNIELKLRNSVDVEQIILGKKKLKRSPSFDRNLAPLKCFELSSSGCDESTTSRARSYTPGLLPNVPKIVASAEKCVQTGDSPPPPNYVDQSTNTADENFVVVDGSYLNILFHNLSLPQIFSGERQYEVNTEALKNIVQTTNMHNTNLNTGVVIEELMDQIKNHDLDRSSTPSTARSLVEEFDQIYKGIAEEDRCRADNVSNMNSGNDSEECVVSNVIEEGNTNKLVGDACLNKSSDVSVDECCSCEPLMVSAGTQSSKGKDLVSVSVAGPLPVPAGAVADDPPPSVATWLSQKSSSTSSTIGENSSTSSQIFCPSVSSLSSPVHNEAEELRRQQLAIEREIKALEQQQCQLLAVREIPDKPPPPYIPPTEYKVQKPPRKFVVDDTAEEKIYNHISEVKADSHDTDPFDVFVRDYCQDILQKQKLEMCEKYWDTSNFIPSLPSKPRLDKEKIAKKITSDLKEVLTSAPPTIVSGVGARRSDHIDDILFAEWRRCEPEWTSLHADEVIVKNQMFESIFQKILTETIDEYKKTVLTSKKEKK